MSAETENELTFDVIIHESVRESIYDSEFMIFLQDSINLFLTECIESSTCISNFNIMIIDDITYPIIGGHGDVIYINYFFHEFLLEANTKEDFVYILFHELGHLNIKDSSNFHKKDKLFLLINCLGALGVIFSSVFSGLLLIGIIPFILNTYFFLKVRRESIFIEIYCDNHYFTRTNKKFSNNRKDWDTISVEGITHPKSSKRNLEHYQIPELDYTSYRNKLLSSLTFWEYFSLVSLNINHLKYFCLKISYVFRSSLFKKSVLK